MKDATFHSFVCNEADCAKRHFVTANSRFSSLYRNALSRQQLDFLLFLTV